MIYLDHNSTTIPCLGLSNAISPYLSSNYGNPSSSNYLLGREAKSAIENSRAQLASLVNCEPEEIIFTSGGTEAIYLSFLGLIDTIEVKNESSVDKIAISGVEHSAVVDAAKYLGKLSKASVINIPINKQHELSSEGKGEDNTRIKIIASMLANNETGLFLDHSNFVKNFGSNAQLIVDPVQAIGKTNFSFLKSGANISFISAHKFGGPKGVGALIVKKNSPWRPSFVGGGQEGGRRGGTESVPLIVGMGYAAMQAKHRLDNGYEEKVKVLRDKFEETLLSEINNIEVVGIDKKRLPNTSCFLTSGIMGGEVAKELSNKNICVSSGSACSSGSISPSRVLTALGYSSIKAISALRVSFGSTNTLEEIPIVVKELKNIIIETRKKNQTKLASISS